jgi:3'(2'), 5'-bisphosphate nucleotidase
LHSIADAVSHLARDLGARAVTLLRAGELAPRQKKDGSWITEADTMAHRALNEKLPRILDLPVLSEEGYPAFGERREWRSFWLIDPIDHTAGLVRGELTHSSVSIALIIDGIPTLGVVAYLDGTRTLQAHDGLVTLLGTNAGATYLGANPVNAPLRFVSYKERLADMSQQTRDIFGSLGVKEDQFVLCDRLSKRFWALLRGEADVYIEPRPLPAWDVAPCLCACMAQGASVLSLASGRSLDYNSETMLVEPFVVGRRGVDVGALMLKLSRC